MNNERSIQAAFRYTRDTVMISWLPLFHDMGLIGGVLQPLYVGFPSVLLAPNLFVREPIRWLRAISEFRGTTTGAPNFAYDHCVDCVSEEQKASLDLSSLTLAYNGSEPVRAATLDRFANAFAGCGFDRKAFFPCYGMAETTLFTSGGPPQRRPHTLEIDASELEAKRLAPSNGKGKSTTLVSCGAVGEGTRVIVVDPLSRRTTSANEIGEIWISGASVAKGYWNQPAESEATFGAFTADTSEGPYLRTGDLGAIQNGELFITGRLKDLIILRGRNIYPQDVERAIEDAAEFVKPNCSAAFMIGDLGQETLAVALEASRELVRQLRHAAKDNDNPTAEHNIQSEGNRHSEVEALVNRIREQIAERLEVVPARVVFVQPGAFPRTSSGKVQRQACKTGLENGTLPAIYEWRAASAHDSQGPVPAPGAETSATTAFAARLVSVINHWIPSQPQLGNRTVTADTNLKSLGLDSLAITSLALEVERQLGVRIAEEIVYECRSVTDLARFVAVLHRENDPSKRGLRSSSAHQINGTHNSVNGSSSSIGKRPEVDRHDFTKGSLNRIEGALKDDAALPGPSARRRSTRAAYDRFELRNERQREWRRAGNYFFASEIEQQAGSWVHVGGRRMLMMASYNYLGLIGHEAVNQAAIEAIRNFGTGAHGARMLAGTLSEHRELERDLARLMNTDDAIVYNSGFLTNVATIAATVGESDLVVGDELNHASIVDGCKQSRAEFRTFRHKDIDHLDQLLAVSTAGLKLVVVDAVYSMEGDLAPLPDIVRVCKKRDALLMVDEAHSLGVLGSHGKGVQEHFQLSDDAIDIKMGTLSKTLASCGGFIAAGSDLIDFLRHHSRGFVFSAALAAPQVAAARRCVKLLEAEPHRVEVLRQNAERMIAGLRRLGFHVAPTESAIVPILFDDEETTLEMVRHCREMGLFVVPVFYPAVPMNAPRIRATVMATHTNEDIDFALSVFAKARGSACRMRPDSARRERNSLFAAL
jgi:8-amino-7-oxononanoate synthase